MPFKIMVVDDEPDLEFVIRQRFKQQIKDKELNFVFASNGVDALNKLKDDSEIDCLLTDINMPEMDGLTLLSELRVLQSPPKAVVVTAYGDMDNIRTAMNRGAFDFLTKPIDLRDLEVTIEKTLQESLLLKQAMRLRDQLVGVQEQLAIARDLQQAILPRPLAWSDGEKGFSVYAQMIPAKEVGGDFYDYFLIDENTLGFVAGDVSGKGIPASIFMAMARMLLKATALSGGGPSQCFKHVNNILCLENLAAMFVTMFYGVLDLRTGEVEYVNGGHLPPYILRKNGVIEAAGGRGGMALGVMSDLDYRSAKLLLEPDEVIFIYTDGVTESKNRGGELFSERRLEQYLSNVNQANLKDIVKGVINDVLSLSSDVPQSDDITVLALRYGK